MTDLIERDPFALARQGEDGDAELIGLFQKWRYATMVWQKSGDDFGHWEAAVTRLAERIFDAPARGCTGSAIKAYMACYYAADGGGGRDDWAASCGFSEYAYARRLVDAKTDTWTDEAHLYMGSHAMRGLMASAASFLPELEPLVAEIINAPLTIPVEDEQEEEEPSVAAREEQPASVDVSQHVERMLRALMEAFPDYDFAETILGKRLAVERS